MFDHAPRNLDAAKIAELGRFYRRHLLEDVMPFWEERTRDADCGGYLTCFDRAGNVTDTDKYMWFQGRQLYMFPALYRHVEKRREWLDLAAWGREFILKHGYAGGGRWNYQLDRQGRVKKGTVSIYTDHFVLGGLCEYALATGSRDDLPLIRATWAAIERATRDPDFKDIYHGVWSPQYQRHSVFMMAVITGMLAGQVLGEERTRPLVDFAIQRIQRVFARDDRRLLFESVGRDGELIDEPEGRVINPGHALESMWFCMETGLRRGDRGIVDRAVEIADWSWRAGWDAEHGGIVSFLDASGQEPKQMDWHKATNVFWHDKVWWVHSEALYTSALAAIAHDDAEWFRRFLTLHEWCQKHFYDAEFGEWYPELWRDGRPKLTDKGTCWKAAYHLPRALMKVTLLFESLARGDRNAPEA